MPSSATYSLVPIATSNVGAVVNSISWSFDSNYLAEGVNNTGSNNNVVVQQFNGTTITTLNGYAGGVNVFSVNWHPSLYWIVATATGFEGTLSYVPHYITLVAFAATPGSVNGTAVAFAPIGTFFAAGGAGFVQVTVLIPAPVRLLRLPYI